MYGVETVLLDFTVNVSLIFVTYLDKEFQNALLMAVSECNPVEEILRRAAQLLGWNRLLGHAQRCRYCYSLCSAVQGGWKRIYTSL